MIPELSCLVGGGLRYALEQHRCFHELSACPGGGPRRFGPVVSNDSGLNISGSTLSCSSIAPPLVALLRSSQLGEAQGVLVHPRLKLPKLL